jgi:hypothetical protein
VNIDERLSALFSALDARPGFNERLLARLHREVVQDAQRVARQTLSPWKEELGRWVNLETVGIAVLAGLTTTSIWSTEQIREYLPQIATAVGVLLAATPMLGPMIRNRL